MPALTLTTLCRCVVHHAKVTDSVLVGNTAGLAGGGVYSLGQGLQILDTNFTGNAAARGTGGAVAVGGATPGA